MKALVILAPGVEEMEAVIIIDCLRRAEADVIVAGLNERKVVASRGVRLEADTLLEEVDPGAFDTLILPGGMEGTRALCGDERVIALAQRIASDSSCVLGFICAAALVLDAAGVLSGRAFTCHPSVAERISSGERRDDRVVTDGNLISSQGPGTAFEFALALITRGLGRETADAVAGPMIL